MFTFSDQDISIANQEDIAGIKDLLNNAYRGENSKQGWTTEAQLITGDTRTNENQLQEIMDQPGSIFLKYLREKGKITGCVNLQLHGNRVYLGMFSVSPKMQGGGIGKKLLLAAEEYALKKHCHSIFMSVISVRTELINWYIRHGYRDTGERRPFAEDSLTGQHVQPLEFMILEKMLPEPGTKIP